MDALLSNVGMWKKIFNLNVRIKISEVLKIKKKTENLTVQKNNNGQ
jgi:hypothetical protein